jgi:hypothetical protein
MNAKYHYKQYVNGEFINCYSLVEIISNDKKTYLVRCLDFCRSYQPGKVLRVKKRSIRF